MASPNAWMVEYAKNINLRLKLREIFEDLDLALIPLTIAADNLDKEEK